MESNVQYSMEGVSSEEDGRALAYAVNEVFRVLETLDEEQPLDLRRMHRVVVTGDFRASLERLSSRTLSGNAITYTNEEYATAVAKVMLFRLPEGGFEIVPVINAGLVSILLHKLDDMDEEQREWFRTVIHMLHHELAHVHDDNKKLDALPGHMLSHRYEGKEFFTAPLAEVTWCEYFANYVSSRTVPLSQIDSMVETFREALERTKNQIDGEIMNYRYHGNLDHVLEVFGRHGEFLVKAAAYVHGYLAGLGTELASVSKEAAFELSGSYFEETWNRMGAALRSMLDKYPHDWTDITVYGDLQQVMESYYAEMGMVLSNQENGQCYIDIPARIDNAPVDMLFHGRFGRLGRF